MPALAKPPFGSDPLLLQQPALDEPAARPCQALLAEPPLSVSTIETLEPGTRAYPGWESDHTLHRRFYLTGMQWILGSTEFGDAKALMPFAERAVTRIKQKDCTWTRFPDPKQHWQALSYNQLRAVRNGEPVYFHKAALMAQLLDTALTSQAGDRVPTVRQNLRRRVRILPAIYRLDGFDGELLLAAAATDHQLVDALAQASSQPPALVEDIAAGHTATRATAHALRHALISAVREGRMSTPARGAFRVTGYSAKDRKALSASPNELIRLG